MHLTSIEQSNIQNIISGLPPNSIKTDNFEQWQITKEYWHLIGNCLDNYFNGRQLIDIPTSKNNLEFIEFLMMSIDQWLRLYDFLSFAWSEIKQNIQLPVETPMDALKWYLVEISTGQVQCKGQFRSRAVHQALTLQNRIDNPSVRLKYQKLVNRIGKENQDLIENNFEAGLFIELTLIIGQKSNNKVIRQKAIDYRKSVTSIQNEIRKWSHPQNGWKNFCYTT